MRPISLSSAGAVKRRRAWITIAVLSFVAGCNSDAPESPSTAITFALQASPSTWTMWRNNLARTSYTPLRGNIVGQPSLRWHVTTAPGLPEPSAVVADVDGDGIPDVITASYAWLMAIKGTTGEILWHVDQEGEFNTGSPAVGDVMGDGGLEVVNGQTIGKVNVRDLKTGALLWSFKTDSPVWSSPALVDINGDGKLDIVICSQQTLYALDANNRRVLWSVPSMLNAYNSPTVGDVDNDGALDVVVGGLEVLCVRLDNGHVKWRAPKQVTESTMVIADLDRDGHNEVIYSIDGHEIGCLNGANGQVKWTFPLPSTVEGIMSSPAVANLDGTPELEVVCGSAGGIMYCLGHDGQLKWKFATDVTEPPFSYIESSATIADIDGDGKPEVMFGSHHGILYCLNGENGTLKWKYAVAPEGEHKVVSSPTFADIDGDGLGEIIVGGNGGGIKCLGSASLH